MKSVIVMCLFSASAVCCHFPKPKFGKEINPAREKIGLEILPATWKPDMVGSDYTVWYNPKRSVLEKQQKAMLYSKSTSYNNKSELISEHDLYYSGRKFRTIDGEESEQLTIEYYFKPQKVAGATIKGWYCTYISPPHDPDTSNKDNDVEAASFDFRIITLAQADSLLLKWGLKPPNRKNN